MRSSGAVRAAVPADSDAMAVIDALASESPWSAAQFRKACENTGENAGECALVFDSGAGAIGFVVFSTVLDEATILNIVVHPQQQRQGVASHLLQALLAVLSVGPARRCLLEVRASNIAGQALYHRFNFEVDGIRKSYYPCVNGREDAVLMSLGIKI